MDDMILLRMVGALVLRAGGRVEIRNEELSNGFELTTKFLDDPPRTVLIMTADPATN